MTKSYDNIAFFEKDIHTCDFLANAKVKVLEKCLNTMYVWAVQLISGLDNQS